jgi:hypothetical protein
MRLLLQKTRNLEAVFTSFPCDSGTPARSTQANNTQTAYNLQAICRSEINSELLSIQLNNSPKKSNPH